MSIPVDVAALGQTLEQFAFGYLLTAAADGRIKAVTTTASVRDGALFLPTDSRGSAANIAANPVVTVLFPPVQPGGYSLIVDGRAAPAQPGPGFVVHPAKAVLHRPAASADPARHAPGCGHDCVPVG